MPTPKPEKAAIDKAAILVDKEDLTVIDKPIDTDDNDEPDADASGDSDDETVDENEAPEVWHKGDQ
jgi:hypothetical protein